MKRVFWFGLVALLALGGCETIAGFERDVRTVTR
ncbi:MAG: entericidin [Pseudomonadota bacterium]